MVCPSTAGEPSENFTLAVLMALEAAPRGSQAMGKTGKTAKRDQAKWCTRMAIRVTNIGLPRNAGIGRPGVQDRKARFKKEAYPRSRPPGRPWRFPPFPNPGDGDRAPVRKA